MKNDDVVAAVLGYRDVDALREANGDDAAFRLAFLLDLPARTPESRMVLFRIIQLVATEAWVPEARQTDDLVEETDRMAGFAVPLEADMRELAARGLGVAEGPGSEDSVAAVYRVCSRATRFLFKAIMITRGDTDEH